PYFRAAAGYERLLPTSVAQNSLFKDFERESLANLHPSRAQQRPHRLRGTPLASNHFTEIFGMNAQLQYRGLRTLDRPDLHLFRMVDEGSGDRFNQFLHEGTSTTRLCSTST